MNGKQPINRGRIRVSSLRLYLVGQQRVLSGVLERSVLPGFPGKVIPPQNSSLNLSRRIHKACWWALIVLSACSTSLSANPGDVFSILVNAGDFREASDDSSSGMASIKERALLMTWSWFLMVTSAH